MRSPHDAVFYKQLDELWTEYEGLSPIREAFDGKGVRVGQGVSRDLPPHLARQKALELAEKRAALSKIMVPEGGRRLGVGPSRIKEKQFSPQELAAMAAVTN